ncbi:MAG TPA: hypothetical protein ENK18_02155 [Deltaproteobacteria bacterium]|nr:hypothetical protein [Deltaproteobacteria bacterium]
MSWTAVRRWRDRLRAHDPAPSVPHLSPQGARAAWDAALDALSDEALDQVAAIEGEPPGAAVMVCARTVFTAPLEWCAVLLGRGTPLILKHPTGQPGITPILTREAQALGLPLSHTDRRDVLSDAALCITMGSDATVASVDEALPEHARHLGFGHRFSVAWITRAGSVAAVAQDAALHDGAGCMSPVALFTPLPPAQIVTPLAAAMIDAQRSIPRGELAPATGATIRLRRALALAVGTVTEGEAWALLELPVACFVPVALPRVLAVHQVADRATFEALLAPHRLGLSTIGTDDPALALPGVRCCAPGQMQRPPLVRHHDGVDWLRRTLG